MIIQDIRKGWPLIVLGLIASMCLIRGCSIIMSPVSQDLQTEGGIRHIVFLQLNADADKAEVIQEIKRIREIDVLRDLEVGLFKDLGDVRALSDYDLAFSMNFKDEDDYQKYQRDSIHLLLKEALKESLSGPPVTYDFEIK
jgi:hypothetical protein